MNQHSLRILSGLTEIEIFECDSMQVTSYTSLLELPKLESVRLAHTNGYANGIWSVFDALIFIHTKPNEFICKVESISKYRKELDLVRPLGKPVLADEETLDLTFLTKGYLYKQFSK